MLDYLWLLPIILSIILFIYSIILINKIKKEYLEKHKLKLDESLKDYKQLLEKQKQLELDQWNTSINNEKNKYNWELQSLKQTIQSETEKRNITIEKEKEIIEKDLTLYKTQRLTQIEEIFKQKTQIEEEKFNKARTELDELLTIAELDKKQVEEELADYKQRRDAINQEIIRNRAIEEQQDFYRIIIDDTAKRDLEVLESIRPRLIKIDLLNKLIYDNYISKPVKEMIKRVTSGRDITGIYKVTCIKTQESYIGKAVNIGIRWIGHNKSAYGLDGVADSMFQRALIKYGIDNFTWEILEEVSKDKLSEREKYYISYYNTKQYGYNERLG